MNDHSNLEQPNHSELISRLKTAFELHEAGVNLMRQNIIRSFPDADDRSIQHLVIEWLQTRPGAKHGDAAGQPRDLNFDS